MFSATVHIQYVSVTCQNIFSNKYKTVHLQRSGARERARVGARACADAKARLFSSGSPVGFSQTVFELSLSVCTADVRSESLPHCFPPVARPGHCFCPSLSLWLPSWSPLWEQSRQASPQQRPLHEHTHRNIRINTLTAEVQNETNICQLTAAFSVLPVARTPPSSLLSTSMKSFFETEQRIFALFLSDPPASFTFSCTVFWCFLTALNSWTTPLSEGGPH